MKKITIFIIIILIFINTLIVSVSSIVQVPELKSWAETKQSLSSSSSKTFSASSTSSRPTLAEIKAEMRSQGYTPQVQDFTYQYIVIFISIICLTLFVIIFYKNFKKIKNLFILFIKKLNSIKKTIAILLYLLFAVSLIYTTFFHVPKYAEYRDSNTKEKIGTGYYNILESYKSFYVPTNINNHSANKTLDLQIDYSQWLVITFVEGIILLLPAVVLYKSTKKD
jgi:hypothetical protein